MPSKPIRPSSGRLLRALLAAAFVTLGTTPDLALAEMLAVGAEMPAFELPDQNGKMVHSADLAGKSYLLWFYPKARTPGCTQEARQLRDRHAELAAEGVVVLGVSFDDPESNLRFVEAEALPFRLLSDEKRVLAVATGAADSTSAWFARRISYLVGPDGKIRKAYGEVDPETHAGEVIGDCKAPASPQ